MCNHELCTLFIILPIDNAPVLSVLLSQGNAHQGGRDNVVSFTQVAAWEDLATFKNDKGHEGLLKSTKFYLSSYFQHQEIIRLLYAAVDADITPETELKEFRDILSQLSREFFHRHQKISEGNRKSLHGPRTFRIVGFMIAHFWHKFCSPITVDMLHYTNIELLSWLAKYSAEKLQGLIAAPHHNIRIRSLNSTPSHPFPVFYA